MIQEIGPSNGLPDTAPIRNLQVIQSHAVDLNPRQRNLDPNQNALAQRYNLSFLTP